MVAFSECAGMVAAMPQYWLKPLGISEPPTPLPDDWSVDLDLDNFMMRTGPVTVRKPPPIGRGDRVLFHAVGHVRIFADAVVLGKPTYQKDPDWGLRWPWVYPCRIDSWVSLIHDGVPTADAVPKRAMGRIQAGGDFAKLTEDQYQAALGTLSSCVFVQVRSDSY
ncbi:MAG: hypothetical protein QOD83_4415 [Solirubrobacteraceae bacterium]|jgi:hypothetical protein|nr:hypothetical protein [Solirubrobacteraceae bacterium]